MDDPAHLLASVIERGSEADLEAWIASGRAGLLVLRQELTGSQPREWRSVHPRDVVDGLTAAAAAIAAEHPDAFLEVFADRAFDEDGIVVTGLGHIDDPRATERLAAAAKSGNSWTRMDAAIGLGRRSAAAAVDALVPLLDDPDYLVRYHTIRSLGAVGDDHALRALSAFRGLSEVERDLAADAVQTIRERLNTRGP